MWQRCQPRPSPSPRTAPPKATPSWERASGGRPVDEYSARRARYRSQDHSRSISSSKGDHLEVSSCDSRRSSGISLPSRTTTHEARLYKGNHLTPTSSRDSISVNSLATETSTDACTKSSVASQASCVSPSYLGQVQLLLSYDIRTACVNVHVIQCRSLPHFGSHKPNPYVKVCHRGPLFKNRSLKTLISIHTFAPFL
ncbi:unnamed protein product [Heligmosomoides polygyrus]|uniref:C2 domain-containing protein n=1 Tax=Heligmosomoides polygyrus TaxID=6339 RepID=A0A183GVM3_HELPZ|nr:unnamed protein product [Heligmosomoides polygyrus]